jgi:hypothetical protein
VEISFAVIADAYVHAIYNVSIANVVLGAAPEVHPGCYLVLVRLIPRRWPPKGEAENQ